jgi:hypothetical protein
MNYMDGFGIGVCPSGVSSSRRKQRGAALGRRKQRFKGLMRVLRFFYSISWTGSSLGFSRSPFEGGKRLALSQSPFVEGKTKLWVGLSWWILKWAWAYPV